MRLSFTFIQDNPTQLKLNRYNPKIHIIKRPQFGKLRKIRRSTGDIESINDKEVSSFTYKEMKSGIVYYVARKFPSTHFKGIKDTFEYILTTKTAQPAQGVVPVDIFSTVADTDDSSTPDVVISDSFFVVMIFPPKVFLESTLFVFSLSTLCCSLQYSLESYCS